VIAPPGAVSRLLALLLGWLDSGAKRRSVIRSAAMDVLKAAGLAGIVLAVILTACSRELPTPSQPTFTIQLRPCCDAPPELLIHDPRVLEQPRTVILVRVIGFEMLNSDENSIPAHATMLVLKSWKGPFSAGDVLHTPKGFIAITGNPEDFISYPFQAGDQGKEFLIMDNGWPRPDILVRRYSAWPAEKSQALMAALDQAVADSMPTDKKGYLARLQKERAALEDLETKMQAVRDRRTALEKQLPGDAAALKQADIEFTNLNYLAWGHRDRAARWQQELRTLGWTPRPPPTAGAPRSDR
jgi:hypothetical protein